MLKRFAAWLAGYAGVSPTVAAERLKGGNDAVERGMRWDAFYREEGGIRDMLDTMRKEAFEAAQEAEVRDDQTRLAWMLQDRAIRLLQRRIENVVATGRIENEKRKAAPVLRKVEF